MNGWRELFTPEEIANIRQPGNLVNGHGPLKRQIVIRCAYCQVREKIVPYTQDGKNQCCSSRCARLLAPSPMIGMVRTAEHIANHAAAQALRAAKRFNEKLSSKTPRGLAISAGMKRSSAIPGVFSIEKIHKYRTWECTNPDGSIFTKVDFIKALETQKGLCGFPDCGKSQFEQRKAFDVDHDHVTGCFRALICRSCNQHRVANHTVASAANLMKYLLRDSVESSRCERIAANV